MSRAACELIKAKSPSEKDVYYFYGSSFGGCFHSQELSLRGAKPNPPDPGLQVIFRKGHESEEETKNLLIAHGFDIRYASSNIKNQHSVHISQEFSFKDYQYVVKLSCHLDGLLASVGTFPDEFQYVDEKIAQYYSKGDMAIYEHKSTGAKKFNDYIGAEDISTNFMENNERYAWQVSAQLNGMAEQLFEEAINKHEKLKQKYNRDEVYENILNSLHVILTLHDRDSQRRIAMAYDKALYTKEDCLIRCNSIVRNFLEDRSTECNSQFLCSYFSNHVDSENLVLGSGVEIIKDDDNSSLAQDLDVDFESLGFSVTKKG